MFGKKKDTRYEKAMEILDNRIAENENLMGGFKKMSEKDEQWKEAYEEYRELVSELKRVKWLIEQAIKEEP